MRGLIHGVLGAALAVLLGAAHGQVLLLEQGAGVSVAAFGAVVTRAGDTAEFRAVSEKALRAPPESAARTRRPSTSSPGALPSVAPASAGNAPVVSYSRGATAEGSRSSECGHCTRAPRPPPIS